MAGVAVALGSPVLLTSRCARARPGRRRRGRRRTCVDFLHSGGLDEHAGDGGDTREVEAGEVVAVGEAVERGVEVGPGVGHHVDAPDLELVTLGVSGA